MIKRWLSTFHNDPQKAVSNLFSGRAGLGSGMRLDIPEILYQEFPSLPEFQDARQKLDTALFAWFTAMRKEYPRQVGRLGFGVYSKRLCDCLIAAQLLDLQMFPYQLRQGLDSWLHWLTPLRLAPERDPALECRRMLARYQKDADHTASWLRLADDGRLEYLNVALLGLRCRPNEHNAQSNQILMLLALLIYESSNYTSGAEANAHFKRRYAALRGLYPRGPQHWQQNLESALAVFKSRAQSKTVRELHQILTEKKAKAAGKSKPKVYPVPKHEFDALLKALKSSSQEGVDKLSERFFTNQKQNLRYAEQTGNSYFFIRTLSTQGGLLLKKYSLSAKIMRRFEFLLEQGLAWEPYNPFVWMLWADWHAKKKQFLQREWILRETVRLFPDNEPSRVELARLLIQRGEEHWDEAQKWLREVIDQHPDNEPSRVELARLLIQRGEEHWDEAEKWLREATERNPHKVQSHTELARLLMKRGKKHWDEAEKRLHEIVKQRPTDAQSHQSFALLLVKRQQQSEAITLLENFIIRTGGNSHITGFLERLRGNQTVETDEAIDDDRGEPSEIEKDNIVTDTVAASEEETGAESRDTASTGLERIMEDIQHRASLQAQFMRTLVGKEDTDTCENLRQLSEQGDTLAGFLQQWLNKDSLLEIPPNAWAWRASRLYQQGTEEEWQQLEQECVDKIPYTRFLRLQAEEKPSDNLHQQVNNWLAQQEEDQSARPLDRYIISAQQQLTHASSDQSKRDAVVFAVCNAAAADAPEISSY